MAGMVKLPILLYRGEDGMMVAECPLIPGCVSQGADREVALLNLREAVDLCLEMRTQEGWTLPASYELSEIGVAQ
ncbi:MAG: type II toxin-antitoxin system HicB family antitoxin [Terriglobales bacterium]